MFFTQSFSQAAVIFPYIIVSPVYFAGALALGRVMSNLIYGVAASDPLTIAAVTLLLGLVAVFASVIPAYRAARIDPLTALREE